MITTKTLNEDRSAAAAREAGSVEGSQGGSMLGIMADGVVAEGKKQLDCTLERRVAR
jgi:hypothetical protein